MIHRTRRALGALAALMFSAMTHAATFVYVSNADSRDISVLQLDSAGALKPLQTVAVGGQAGPLAISPDRRFLYVALRSQPYTVSSFAIDAGNGQLKPLGDAPLPDSMAHIATDRSGRHLFGASYGGHKVSVSPIAADGRAGEPVQVLPTGQNAHASLVDPSNRYVFVTNLGSDAVMQWRFDADRGTLQPNEPATLAVRAKAGPRHLVFHPNGRFVALLNELDASVEMLAFDRARGTLSSLQTLSTLPEGFAGKPWAADLHFSPDGRFLYTSERTSSTLAAFSVDAATGRLALVAHTPTEKQPRGFAVDPRGRWLLAAGQLSHAVTVYAMDRDNGGLQPLKSIPVGQGPHWVEIVSLP
ncbi:lactonase family protein [Ideonella sp. BN130291]|uniref:lactonase family protein n=1 Tax=Ideonella sp. BN130291 TaxID=3112940 RepID=UPI002E273674|nr:beta-propeller fold lactonase family protein [Ideonella sp. BN130291]